MELESLGNPAEALACFERACALNPSSAWAGFSPLKRSFFSENIPKPLVRSARRNLVGHATAQAAEFAGDANYILGQYDAAAGCYRKGLKRSGASATLETKLSLAEGRSGGVFSGTRRPCQAPVKGDRLP